MAPGGYVKIINSDKIDAAQGEETPILGNIRNEAVGINGHSNGHKRDHETYDITPSFFKSPLIKKKSRVQVQYDPESWIRTVFAVLSHSYISYAFLSVALAGTGFVLASALPIFRIPESERTCRAWCSRLSLGSQVHQYLGIILFLIMAFRNNTAVAAYKSGLIAFFSFKTTLRSFINVLLNRVPRDAISPAVRARAVSLAIAYPYSVMLDLREQKHFGPGSLQGVLSNRDLAAIENSATLPVQVLEMLTKLIADEIKPHVDVPTANGLYGALGGLVAPYGECERIKQSPCVLSYVAHLRALLVAYLVSLPLALVEQMGLATIPVVWVVCFALMSLEMLAVDVENPFDGCGKSDLKLSEQCNLIKEQALESWQRFDKPETENGADDFLYQNAVKPLLKN